MIRAQCGFASGFGGNMLSMDAQWREIDMPAETARRIWSGSMAWLYLAIAGVLEVVWALGLKMSAGFTRPLPSAVTLAGAAASFYFLALALRDLPVGTGYAVWVGIGAVGTAVFGIVLLGESLTPLRAGGIALIVAGVALLKFAERA